MSSVTLIDLEGFRRGSAADRSSAAVAIDDACRDTGFLQVVGHGVDESIMSEMLEVTAEFFDQPLELKQQAVVPDLSANRGYSAVGSEALAYSLGNEPAAPDLFEAFNAGRAAVEGPYFDRYRSFYAENVWPDSPIEMPAVWGRYQRAVNELADHLLRAFALALEVPESYFVDRTRNAILTTRAINYQRHDGAPDPLPGQMRMGAHTDYGVLTVLNADDAPGLEVWYDGCWNPVSVPSGSLLINIGDMLATWTNDRWVSTLHRVVPPPPGPGPARRRSVAQFLEANPGCLIECIPSCTSAENPPRYAPIEAGAYLMAKLMGPRELRKSEVPD